MANCMVYDIGRSEVRCFIIIYKGTILEGSKFEILLTDENCAALGE